MKSKERRKEQTNIDELIKMLATIEPEEIVRVTTRTKHPQEHGEQEGVPRGDSED